MATSSFSSFSPILRGLLLTTAIAAAAAAGCDYAGGESCSMVPACKFVDLLAGCDAATGCTRSGSVEISGGTSSQDPTAVQEQPTGEAPQNAAAFMGPTSALSIQLPSDASTRAALPILDVVFEGAEGDLDLAVDGASPCAPQSGPAFETVEWRCPLPAGAKSLALTTAATKVTVTSVQLTEATCTGTAQSCAL